MPGGRSRRKGGPRRRKGAAERQAGGIARPYACQSAGRGHRAGRPPAAVGARCARVPAGRARLRQICPPADLGASGTRGDRDGRGRARPPRRIAFPAMGVVAAAGGARRAEATATRAGSIAKLGYNAIQFMAIQVRPRPRRAVCLGGGRGATASRRRRSEVELATARPACRPAQHTHLSTRLRRRLPPPLLQRPFVAAAPPCRSGPAARPPARFSCAAPPPASAPGAPARRGSFRRARRPSPCARRPAPAGAPALGLVRKFVRWHPNLTIFSHPQEHPYYASFGYHVSSFFAASSRCAHPRRPRRRARARFPVGGCLRAGEGESGGGGGLLVVRGGGGGGGALTCGRGQLRGSGLAEAAHRRGARRGHLGPARHGPLPRWTPRPPPSPLLPSCRPRPPPHTQIPPAPVSALARCAPARRWPSSPARVHRGAPLAANDSDEAWNPKRTVRRGVPLEAHARPGRRAHFRGSPPAPRPRRRS